jgi:hypothetical protein
MVTVSRWQLIFSGLCVWTCGRKSDVHEELRFVLF